MFHESPKFNNVCTTGRILVVFFLILLTYLFTFMYIQISVKLNIFMHLLKNETINWSDSSTLS